MSFKKGIWIILLIYLLFFSIAIIIPSSANNPEYIPSQLIVRFNPDLFNNDQELNDLSSQLHAEYNATVLENSTILGIPGAQLIRLPDNVTVEEATIWYRNNSSILFAEPNYIRTIPLPVPPSVKEEPNFTNESSKINTLTVRLASVYPNDPYFSKQWYLNTIQIPPTWDITKGSDSVIIAVLDTGVNYNHPEFVGNIWVNPKEIPNNNLDDDQNGFIDDLHGWDFAYNDNSPLDDYGHGTMIASIIGSKGNNFEGLAGMMWNVKIMPIKIFTPYSYAISDEIKGINYARMNGAKIIVCSFSGEYYISEQTAIEQAQDLLFVCAAGNDGIDADKIPIYPASYSYSNIMSVAATDENDDLCYFSNYGQNRVDVGAPGINISVLDIDSNYKYNVGTSFSAPQVAGLAGLILSLDPTKSASELRQLIMDNVDITQLHGYVRSGGRINAYKTLLAISKTPTPTPTTPTSTPTLTPTTTTPTPTPTATQPTSPLTPDFTVSHTSGVAPLTVHFQDTSMGNPTGWIWDINGDGFQDYSDKSFEHTFTSPGIYSVTFTVTRNQELATISRNNYINVLSKTPANDTIALDIHTGWNFVSTPNTLVEGHRSIGEVFKGINSGGRSIFLYNAESQSWNQLNSQDEIQCLRGIWVYSTTSTQVPLMFSEDPTNSRTYELFPGWNAIGFTQMVPFSAKDALFPVQNSWTQLIGFNAESQLYETSIVKGGSGSHIDTNLVYPGKGYWVYMNYQGTLS